MLQKHRNNGPISGLHEVNFSFRDWLKETSSSAKKVLSSPLTPWFLAGALGGRLLGDYLSGPSNDPPASLVNPTSDLSVSIKPGQDGIRRYNVEESITSASKGIKSGRLSKDVEVIRNSSGYTFIFPSKSSNGAQSIFDVDNIKERDTAIKELKAAGGNPKQLVLDLDPPLDTAIETKESKGLFGQIGKIFNLTLLVAPVVAIFWYFNKIQKGLAKEGGGQTLRTFDNPPKERLNDIGGNQTVVEEFREILNGVEKFKKGEAVYLPKGILLNGPPGAGKTFHAKCLAGEAGSAFGYFSASDVLSSPYIGGRSAGVKRLWTEIRKLRDQETKRLRSLPGATGKEKGIVFVYGDEFDSVGRSREKWGTHEESVLGVNAFLAEMDGIDSATNEGIIILAGTNNADSVDSAFKRPGRFTQQITLRLPETTEERVDVLEKSARRLLPENWTPPTHEELNQIAELATGYSCDHLANIIIRGLELARRDEENLLTEESLLEAFQQVLFGLPNKNLMRADRQEIVAAHELGHALIGLACGLEPAIVSKLPRGSSQGRVVLRASHLLDPPQLKGDLFRALLLQAGGRAGEICWYGDAGQSNGVNQDFSQMKDIAIAICKAGMDGEIFIFTDTDEFSGEEVSRIGKICEGALRECQKILEIYPLEVREKVFKGFMELPKELMGSEASQFFKDLIPEDILREASNVVNSYVKGDKARRINNEDSHAL